MAKLKHKDLEKSLKEKKAKWKAKKNPISLMDEDKQKKLLGFEKPKKSKKKDEDDELESFGFADEVDWRNSGNVTPIKNQGQCGSCVSFCTVSVLESMVSIEKGELVDLSEADQHFCSSHGPDCSGWYHMEAFEEMKLRGVCDETCFPYRDTNPTCNPCSDRDSKAVKISNINEFTSLSDVKNYLSSTGPVAGAMAVYQDFYSYGSGVYEHVSGSLQGYHCISIIGYSEIDQCWICKNSWGTGWGDNGYFKIAYGDSEIDSFEKLGVSGVLLPDDPVPPPPPQDELYVNPSVQNVTHLAGYTTFNVVSNVEWSATSDSSWCTIDIQEDTIIANYSDNSKKPRTALITVIAGTETVIVTVKQSKVTREKKDNPNKGKGRK